MADSRKPGPRGLTQMSGDSKELNDGTMIQAESPRPGPVGWSAVPLASLLNTRSSARKETSHKGRPIPDATESAPESARNEAGPMQLRLLREGWRGPAVKKLQRQLNARMSPTPNLIVDGVFGSTTHEAVLRYQEGVAIAANGIIWKRTWYHLLKGDKVNFPQVSIRRTQPGSSGPATAPKGPGAFPSYRVAPPPTSQESVWEWPLEKKLLVVVERVPKRLGPRARDEFLGMLNLESLGLSLAIIAGFCLLSGGTALVLGVFMLGLDVTMSLASALQTAALAATEQELDEAADQLAHVILAVGVAVFIQSIGKIAKGLGGGGKEVVETPQESIPAKSSPKTGSSEPPPAKPATLSTPAPEKSPTELQLDEMYSKAPVAKTEVDSIGESIAKKVKGRLAKDALKSRSRALEKALNDYKGDASKVKDIARNTIVVDQDHCDEAVALLREQGAKVKIIDAVEDPMGYSGANAVVKTKAGIFAEIQVNSPEMIYAKEPPAVARTILGEEQYNQIAAKVGVPGGRGHVLYEEVRSLDVNDPRREELAAESREYYDYVRKTWRQ